MSKILVTGGGGFIGSHLTDRLVEEGHEVVVVDNLSTGKEENLNPKARFMKQDIIHKGFWDMLAKVDLVYHVAALARIQPSIEDPLPGHKVNVDGTLNVLEYCRRKQVKLIFSSSSSIYRSVIAYPTRETALKEAQNPYSLQKIIDEQYIELYAKLYGLNYVILRYFNVFGPRQLTEGAYATALGIFLKQKAEGKPLTITNDGEQRRDFTYVGDVVKANIMAMDWKGAFNIGAGHNYSINEVADLIGGERGYMGVRLGEVRETLADNSKARKMGWFPTPNALEDYIKESL